MEIQHARFKGREIQANHWTPRQFMKLTEQEIQKEWLHRRENRLGDLCGAGAPTQEQLGIATKEADQWRANYQKSQEEPMLI